MVRPHTEYGNVIWSPYYQVDVQSLESIQRRAMKLITALTDITYKERLMELKLRNRRRRGDDAGVQDYERISANGYQ